MWKKPKLVYNFLKRQRAKYFHLEGNIHCWTSHMPSFNHISYQGKRWLDRILDCINSLLQTKTIPEKPMFVPIWWLLVAALACWKRPNGWLCIYVYLNLYVTSKVSYTWVISKGCSSLCKSIHISIWLICLWQINSCPVFCYSVSCFSRQFIGRSSHTCAGSEPPTDCWKQCLILITTWMEGTSSQMHRAFDDQV